VITRSFTLLERWLGHLVGLVAVTLLLAEIGIMGSSVVARYVFHNPLVWTDELASILFLWLSMLGAVMARDGGGCWKPWRWRHRWRFWC